MNNFGTFSGFEEYVAGQLRKELPGKTAHGRMASAHYKGWPEPQEKSRMSAVLILFYPVYDEIVFPVIRRPTYDGVHSGQIAFPGGKMDKTDLDLTHTALREAWEEIGVTSAEVNILGQLSEIYITVSDMRVVPVVGSLPFRPDFVPDAREVQEIREIGLSGIRDQQIIREGKIPVRGGFVKSSYYDYDGLQIWGATAMMISELLEILEG